MMIAFVVNIILITSIAITGRIFMMTQSINFIISITFVTSVLFVTFVTFVMIFIIIVINYTTIIEFRHFNTYVLEIYFK